MTFYSLFLCLILFVGCGKNGPKSLVVDKANSYKTFKLLPSCESVDFNQNYLIKKNVESFFNCLSWSENYPKLYAEIKSFDEQKWNNHFLQINEKIFSKSEKKKFINFLVKLKNQNKLESLQEQFAELSKVKNINNIVKKILIVLENNPSLKKENIISAQELKDYLTFYQDIMNVLKNNQKELSQASVFDKVEFNQEMISLVDSFTDTFLTNDLEASSKLSLFFQGTEKNWINNEFLAKKQNETKRVLDFAFTNLTRTQSVLRSIDPVIKEESIACESLESEVRVYHKKEIRLKLHDATMLKHQDYLLSMLDLGQKFTFLKEVCKNDENFTSDLNTIEDTLNYLYEFVSHSQSFSFFKNLQYAATLNNPSNVDGLINFLVSDDMEELTKFLYKFVVQDDKYFSIFFNSLREVNPKTFDLLGKSFLQTSENKSRMFNILANTWESLSLEEKNAVVDIISLPLTSKSEHPLAFIEFLNFFYEEYLSGVDAGHNSFKKSYVNNTLQDILIFFTDDEIFQEVTGLMQSNGIFTLLNLLVGGSFDEDKPEAFKIEISESIKLDESQSNDSHCLREILSLNKKGYSFGDLISEIPLSCDQNPEKFISKIFKVSKMFSQEIKSNNAFDAFEKGIFSSEFLKIHAGLFLSDSIKINYDKIMGLNNTILNYTHLLEEILLELDEKKLLSPLIKSVVKTFAANETSTYFNSSLLKIKTDESKAFKSQLISVIESLVKENANTTLLSEFLSGFDRKNGVSIPYNRNKQYQYNLKVEQLVELLYDHSDEIRDVYYFPNENKTEVRELNLLERLEVVIDEISFANNYYGAYFVNEVSKAKDYSGKTKRLRLSLKAMKTSIPLFIKMNYVEADAQRRMININNTYSSLYELDYKRPTYSEGSYGEFIQSVLAIIVNSSPLESREIKVLQRPIFEKVKGHNVNFMTSLVQMSFFSNTANFLKTYLAPTKEEFFSNSEIKSVLSWLDKNLQDENFHHALNNILLKILENKHLLNLLTDYHFTNDVMKLIGKSLVLMAKMDVELRPLLNYLVSLSFDENLKSFEHFFSKGLINTATNIVQTFLEDKNLTNTLNDLLKGKNRLFEKLHSFERTELAFTLINKTKFETLLRGYKQQVLLNSFHENDYFYQFFKFLLKTNNQDVTLLNEMLIILLNDEGETLEEFLNDISEKVTISL